MKGFLVLLLTLYRLATLPTWWSSLVIFGDLQNACHQLPIFHQVTLLAKVPTVFSLCSTVFYATHAWVVESSYSLLLRMECVLPTWGSISVITGQTHWSALTVPCEILSVPLYPSGNAHHFAPAQRCTLDQLTWIPEMKPSKPTLAYSIWGNQSKVKRGEAEWQTRCLTFSPFFIACGFGMPPRPRQYPPMPAMKKSEGQKHGPTKFFSSQKTSSFILFDRIASPDTFNRRKS